MIYGILVNSRPDKPLPPPRWLAQLRNWFKQCADWLGSS